MGEYTASGPWAAPGLWRSSALVSQYLTTDFIISGSKLRVSPGIGKSHKSNVSAGNILSETSFGLFLSSES